MSNLVKYEAACLALAECKAIDEVKEWVDKAAAMQAYSRMAKDKTLEIDAAEIRIRAERRLGQMLVGQKAEVGLNQGRAGRAPIAVDSNDRDTRPTLSQVGISKDLSSKAQKLAAVPDAEFESEVGQWRERVQAEGARVSARLESAGERELKKQEPEDDGAPDDAEMAALAMAEQSDREAMEKLLDADDKLATAFAEIKRLNAELAQMRISRDGYMNKCNEAIALVKKRDRQISAMERAQREATA